MIWLVTKTQRVAIFPTAQLLRVQKSPLFTDLGIRKRHAAPNLDWKRSESGIKRFKMAENGFPLPYEKQLKLQNRLEMDNLHLIDGLTLNNSYTYMYSSNIDALQQLWLTRVHMVMYFLLQRWATILTQPHVSRVGDACDAAERAAALFASARPPRQARLGSLIWKTQSCQFYSRLEMHEYVKLRSLRSIFLLH